MKSFKSNSRGAISVEFALIAPIFFLMMLFAFNVGFKIKQKQKLASSVAAGSDYLMDYTIYNGLDALRDTYNSQTSEFEDSDPVYNTRLVIRDAFGAKLDLSNIGLEFYCACPRTMTVNQDGDWEKIDFEKDDADYYQSHRISTRYSGELCNYECQSGVGGKARVFAEFTVEYSTEDLFANQIELSSELRSRLR